MLFNTQAAFESEKERNLYFKFFAGYFFNELISGYEKRVENFCELINESAEEYINYSPTKKLFLSPKNTYATFDIHAYLFDSCADKGELADILVYDMENKTMLCIEAKFLSNWTIKKDINQNASRIVEVEKIKKGMNLIQVLLVTNEKWGNVRKQIKKDESNYRRLCDNKDVPVVILTWEKLIDLCDDENIRNYFTNHISKKKEEFRCSCQ
jgi:hypothetical protein